MATESSPHTRNAIFPKSWLRTETYMLDGDRAGPSAANVAMHLYARIRRLVRCSAPE
jgi:hypothetical protein